MWVQPPRVVFELSILCDDSNLKDMFARFADIVFCLIFFFVVVCDRFTHDFLHFGDQN